MNDLLILVEGVSGVFKFIVNLEFLWGMEFLIFRFGILLDVLLKVYIIVKN